MSRYQVETLFIDSWENCWKDNDDSPVTFATKEEAEAELKQFLADADAAFQAGDLVYPYDAEDYRVTEVE